MPTSCCISSQISSFIAPPVAAFCTKSKQFVLDLLTQLQSLASKTFQSLKNYAWKLIFRPSLTEQIIGSQSNQSLSIGQIELPIDLIKSITTYLPAQDMQSFLLTSKSHLSLLKETEVMDKLFSSPPKEPFKSASILGPYIKNVTTLNFSKVGWKTRPLIHLIQKCPNLTSLDLSSYSRTIQETIPREVFETIAKSCKNLATLNLEDSNYAINVPDEVLETLAKNCKKLVSLNLQRGKWISDRLISIMKHNTQLLHLNLSRTHIKDQDIQLIAEKCHELRSLELVFNTHLTDKAIEALAEGCTKLESLNLELCNGFSHEAILKLVNSCPNLRVLNLRSCPQISRQTIDTLAQNYPQLRLIHSRN